MTERSVPWGSNTGVLKMYGVGHCNGISLANNSTKEAPAGNLALTSTDCTPGRSVG